MRYIIGIDLGTTNSCAAFVDTEAAGAHIQHFHVPQLVSEGYLEDCSTLPSFCYLTNPREWAEGAVSLPWKKDPSDIVGFFAQALGAKTPGRLVQSAKSWLCHAGASRREKILPFDGSSSDLRLSPIEASAKYLSHLREAWNHRIARGDPSQEFEQQEIILTVPASFDEVARRLTAEAAVMAGLTNLKLLEEPQAAFYSWISLHEKKMQKSLPSGSQVLVCDVGGGTTDFSLIEASGPDDSLSFQRMAVGRHLLLGGDNMDAALAHELEKRYLQEELTPHQWQQLLHQARRAKESLLKDGSNGSYQVVLHGRGSSVVEGSCTFSVSKEQVLKLLLEGFFGDHDWEEALKLHRGSGIRSMGLPFEEDPSIIKHLAHFLHASAGPGKPPKQPDYVLFNGGTMKPLIFQEAVLKSLRRWFPEKNPTALPSYNLDLAVARGAAYYGKARRGLGVRIGGGTARGYYLALDLEQPDGSSTRRAMALLPRGTEEGVSYEPRQTFWLSPNTPVSFQLYSSHVRLDDRKGDLIEIDDKELQPLPAVHTLFRYGKQTSTRENREKVPVRMGVKLTEIGTLEIGLLSQKTDHRWALEFQTRNASGQDNSLKALAKSCSDETFDQRFLGEGRTAIDSFFSGTEQNKPGKLMETLEEMIGRPRRDWPPSILRGLWEAVLKQAPRRKASPAYEARWWNLAGFLLRPGFGFPLDDFRLKELWKLILADLKVLKAPDVQIQHWICYRRVAGGLGKGQQMQLASDLLASIFQYQNGKEMVKNKAGQYPYSERLRAVAAMELIDTSIKIKLGNALLDRISKGNSLAADYWALARLGSRHLFYGSIANIIPASVCAGWVEQMLAFKNQRPEELAFVIGQLARKSSHREINLPEGLIAKVLDAFGKQQPGERLQLLLREETCLTHSEQEQIFGEQLPTGLTLLSE